MSDASIESVVYVCRAESARLRQLVNDLEHAEPRRLDGILRSLSKTGDTLSSALARAASYVDHLDGEAAPDNAQNTPAPADAGLLQVISRLRIGARFGVCPACGGIQTTGGGHGRFELDADDHATSDNEAAAKIRAHRAEEARS